MENLPRCLIGIPNGSGFIPAYVVDGLFKINRPIPTSLLIIERQTVDSARNYIIEVAIKTGVEYLLFLDDDGVMPANTLELMLSDDKDIVGAPMMTRNAKEDGKHKLCCFNKVEFPVGNGRFVYKYKSIDNFDMSKGPLHRVDAIGGACLLIKRNVFIEMFKKYNGTPFEFIREFYDNGEGKYTVRNVSEDLTFAERAVDSGFEIWVDTRIRPIHLGKPEFIRFEQEGENLSKINPGLKSAATLSESLI